VQDPPSDGRDAKPDQPRQGTRDFRGQGKKAPAADALPRGFDMAHDQQKERRIKGGPCRFDNVRNGGRLRWRGNPPPGGYIVSLQQRRVGTGASSSGESSWPRLDGDQARAAAGAQRASRPSYVIVTRPSFDRSGTGKGGCCSGGGSPGAPGYKFALFVRADPRKAQNEGGPSEERRHRGGGPRGSPPLAVQAPRGRSRLSGRRFQGPLPFGKQRNIRNFSIIGAHRPTVKSTAGRSAGFSAAGRACGSGG